MALEMVDDGTFEEELQRGPTGQQLEGQKRLVRGTGRTSYSSLAMVAML